MREAFAEGRGAYGYRRVHAALRAGGARVSEKRVRRVMREEGLVAAGPRRRRGYSSYRGEGGMAGAPNLPLLDEGRDLHEFRAPAPGLVLATDISEFRLGEGGPKACLSPAVDPCDGRVVAAAAGPSPNKELVRGMLESAAAAVGHGFVPRSDRGWHYRTPDWVAACEAAGVARSLSRKARSPDNAAAEALFGRLKVEMFQGRGWEGWDVGRFVSELEGYIEWHNSGRLKAFREDGRTVYETIDGRRARLGLAA